MPNFASPKDRGKHCSGEDLNKMTLGTVHKVGQKARPQKSQERQFPTRASVKFLAVCAGAPAVAICVGALTAWAAPSTSDSASSNASVTQQTTKGSLSISARGNSLVQLGNESTATTNGASLAVAFNRPGMEGSTAEANGTGNFVVAGNNGHAQVTGNFNMVRVIHNSDAEVTGNFNTVTVISNSDAEVTGNRNMVTALCGGSAEVSNQNDQVVLKAPCLGR